MNPKAYTPSHSRQFFGHGNETYACQLGIGELPDLGVDSMISLLDVAAGNSGAVPSLLSRYQGATATLLDQSYINDEVSKDGNIIKKRVDLDDIESIRNAIGKGEKFDMIFINQGLQYVENPFGLVKYIFENCLKLDGYFYWNISCNIFEHGSSVTSVQLFEHMERSWRRAGILTSVSTWNNMKQYHFHKPSPICSVKVPEYRGYIGVGSQGFRRQKYDFRSYVNEE